MSLESDPAVAPDSLKIHAPSGRSHDSILGHVVINFFNLIILAPLAWVLLMSVKSLPDAMRGNIWPSRFDFTHYSFVFHRIRTLPINLFNSAYVTTATVLITSCSVT